MKTEKKKKIAIDMLKIPPLTREELINRHNISKNTYYKLVNEDMEFYEILSTMTTTMCDDVMRDITKSSQEALNTIKSIMQDKKNPASVRLKASMCILEYMYQNYENTNIIDRMNYLEDIVAAEKVHKN